MSCGKQEKKDEELRTKDSELFHLKNELVKMSGVADERVNLAKELAIQYPEIMSFSVSRNIFYDNSKNSSDTIPVFYAEFSKKIDPKREQQLTEWLKLRLEYKKLMIVKIDKDK